MCAHPIKRAYELSVCITRTRLQNPDYRADGYVWDNGSTSNGHEPVDRRHSDQRVQFSFHIVEIS